jgi:predicted regulator of Ras-like GTPase activity (Roadblock/LC7/MglB family)
MMTTSIIMADYYALLARAIEKQPGASPEARNYVYETARTALLAQLRATQPPPPEANIMAEQRALDEAIRQVEAGIEGDAHDSPAPPAVSPEAPKHETKRPGGWISDLLLRASRDTGRAIPPTASEESKSNSSQMDVGRRPTAAPSAAPDVSRPVAPKGTKAAAKPVVSAPLFATTARPQIQPPAHSTSGSRFAQEKPMSRLDELNRVLRKLQTDCPGVEASALISEDGLMLASALPSSMDEARVAGMAATLLNLGSRAALELTRGAVQEVIVRGERGYAVLISAGRGALLLAITNESSKLGLVFFDMREAIRALQKVL